MTATLAIIFVTLLVSYAAWQSTSLFQRLVHVPYLVKRKSQYYRLLTSGFIHANYMHLLFNMLTLYFFGDLVATLLQVNTRLNGELLFLGLYLGGIVVSDIPTLLRHKDHSQYSSLGASGGVSAVVFSYIAIQPTQSLCLFFILCLPGFVLGILYLMYSWYMAKNPQDHINHEAHLYGALFGLLYTLFFAPEVALSYPEKFMQMRLFF